VDVAVTPAPGSLAPVTRLLEDGVGRAYPGAVVAVLFRGEVILRQAVGLVSHKPAPRAATPATIYDLASLTKVVATTPLILQATAEGRLGLDDPLSTHIPDSPHSGITLRHLLTHTSGLPAWIPFYLDESGYEAIVRRAAAVSPEFPPGAQVVYSDLGFILLGEVARRSLGAPLDTLARTRLFAPLGMADTGYLPTQEMRGRIAPTEDGTAIEQGMTGAAGRRYRWRHRLIWGEVHDSNAYAMGGVSGHAGVFGTADDLIAYARMWLAGGRGPKGPIIPPDLVRQATTRQMPAQVAAQVAPQMTGAASRGLGWALSGSQGWWGDRLSARAYGHTGFTGTALVVDPEHDLAIVFLTNAVHFGRDRTEILALRPQVATAVARALL
jgi:serine-type D-Ala-D-Ala carboxypeptidase